MIEYDVRFFTERKGSIGGSRTLRSTEGGGTTSTIHTKPEKRARQVVSYRYGTSREVGDSTHRIRQILRRLRRLVVELKQPPSSVSLPVGGI